MLESLPKRAFFEFEIPVRYIARPPRIDGLIAKWGREFLAPPLHEIDRQPAIADVYWAWNEDGFYAAFDVPERRGPLRCDPEQWWACDGLRLCIDTRGARDIRRGTRFCHFFYLLPSGGGRDRKRPLAGLHRMSRAKEHPPIADTSAIKVAVHVERTRYSLEVGIPAACLHGWNPVEHPRVGLFYKVKDLGLGSQTLTVSDELGWNVDPSTWATGMLAR